MQLTQAALDELYRAFMDEATWDAKGRPLITIVVSRRTSARIEQAWLRGIKRRARRKALKRRFK
jgi:hypothetical protein